MGPLFIARYATKPSQNRIDNGLIEGDPQVAVFAQVSRHLFRKAFEEGDDGRILPAAAMGEPKSGGEVVERDHRLEAVIDHASEDRPVAVDGIVVPDAFARFDTAPFNRHAVGVLSHRGGCFQIGFGVVPPVAGLAAGLSAIDVAGSFPGMPVVVNVAAFHLMRGSGATPEKSGWEVENLFGLGRPPGDEVVNTDRWSSSCDMLPCGPTAEAASHQFRSISN